MVTITFNGKPLAQVPDGANIAVTLDTAGPPPPPPPPARPTETFDPAFTPDQVRALVNTYIAAGGVANTDNGQYWVTEWPVWGSHDPAYFRTRLEQGIAQQPGYNGIFSPFD
jgi:hypothetical protein